jgi:hypothetical protein
MLRTIDRYNGHAIQKVSNIRGETVRYQTVRESSIGDASQIVAHKTLKDARQHVGQPTPKVVTFTAPKASYAYNRKGYRADNKRAK